METKRIIIIALVVFMSLSLIFYSNIQTAYAFTAIDRDTAETANYSYYNTKNSVLYQMSTTSTITRIDGNTHIVLGNAVAIPKTGTVAEPVSPNNGQAFDLGTGNFQGIWCGSSYCYTVHNNGTFVVVRTNLAMTTLTHFFRIGTIAVETPLEGIDVVTGGFGSITLWYVRNCSGADTDRVGQIFDGISMLETGTIGGVVCSGGSDGFGANNINDIEHIDITASTPRRLIVTTNSAGPNVYNFNLSTNQQTCTKTISTPTHAIELNSTEFLVAYAGVSGDIDRISMTACADRGDITDVTLGSTGFTLSDIDVSTLRNEIYAVGTNSQIMTVNSTSMLKTWQYILPTASPLNVWGYTITNTSKVATVASNGASTRIIILDSISGGQTGSTVCIDTTGDTVADLCFTDTNGDGVADGGDIGSLGVYRSNANITTFGSFILCGFGINSNACTDDNPKTNGVGLIYLLVLIIWSYAFLVAIHYTAQTKIAHNNVQVMDVLHINPILLLVMLIIDVGITFYLGWIPDLIFYTTIVLLVGLAGFGVYKKLGGGNA